MLVEILTEPDFEESSWGRVINESLSSALVKKKINFTKIENLLQISKKDTTHFLFVIGSDVELVSSSFLSIFNNADTMLFLFVLKIKFTQYC